jgi:thiol-disulfide isomerase/thioredoxin
MSRGRVIGLVLVAGAVAAFVIFGLASSHSASGRAAPALPTERLAGAPTTLAGLVSSAHGRPAFVVFWASWCGPCSHEAPEIERFARSAAGRGRIVGVDWSDARPGAVAFVHHYGWTFPNLRDGEGTVGNNYELTGLPTTFVLNGSGRIVRTLRGPQTQTSLEDALHAQESS